MFRTKALQCLILACLSVFPTLSKAQEDSELKKTANDFFEMTRKTVLSCETLVVLDYPKGDEPFSFANSVTPIAADVDASKCRKILTPTTFDKPLKSFLVLVESVNEPLSSKPLSKTEREVIRNKQELDMQNVAKSVKSKLNPFVEYCRSLKPAAAPDHNRVCYFGAANSNTGGPATSVFSAMANGILTTEAMCAPNPLSKKVEMEPEFQSFLAPADKELTWSAIRQSLSKDGFSCSEGGERDGCRRWVLGVYLNMLPNTGEEQIRGIYGKDAIVAHELAIYEGKWFEPGPRGGKVLCDYDKVTKKETCPLAPQPKRGTKEGICMVPEDWHAFYGVPLVLNAITP